MKKIVKKSALILAASILSFSAFAAPTEIHINNETDLSLATSIAGLPGHGIDPSVSKPVPYNLVLLGCASTGKAFDCPITFTDRATNQKVAEARINASIGKLLGAPVFFGDYGKSYVVEGWDQEPLSHLTIKKK